MTTAVTIKNITFQEGTTLICVPLIGQTLDELKAHARTLAEAGADLIEWRVDHFTAVGDRDQVLLALTEIRRLLADIPLLFTFRSHKEEVKRRSAMTRTSHSTVWPLPAGWWTSLILSSSMTKCRSGR